MEESDTSFQMEVWDIEVICDSFEFKDGIDTFLPCDVVL